MRYNFIKFGTASNLDFDPNREDYFFFEQNRDKLERLFEFLYGPKPCFVLSGLQGVGKSKFINEALSYLNPNVLLFKYRMYEATTLDDILMNMMIDFRELQKNNQTTLPKIDTKDFRLRIQHYVKAIEKPMLMVLESYSDIQKNEEVASGINEFLFHLAANEKFKIIFISRTFDSNILAEHMFEYDQTIITSSNERGLQEYILQNNINGSKESIDKLLKASHCYLKYIDLTIKLLNTFNISLDELMKEHELRNINFSTFIINKFISLIPENSKELVYLLSLIRQGVSEKFLISINSRTQALLPYLKNIKITNEDDKKNIYIKDYFKREIIKEIDQFSTQRIHKFLADTYSNMLPKKPFERELVISRSTMQRERDFHAGFIPNYVPPSTFSKYVTAQTPTNKKVERTNIEPDIDYNQITENDYLSQNYISNITNNQSIENINELARERENNFDYQSAILFYQQAVSKQEETDYNEKKPELLKNIARCYSKLRKSQNAITYLELAMEIYEKNQSTTDVHEMLYEIANEYKHDYKFLVSKSYLNKILTSVEPISPEIQAKTYNLLADMEDLTSNIAEAKNLYKKGLQYALSTTNKELISTSFFKYGLLLDDTNQQTFATECYQKCIETCPNPEENTYLSSAYSNLAGIYAENNDRKKAFEYYHKALEADKITQNHEGIYFVYTRLSSMYTEIEPQTSYQFLVKALKAAKKINDNIYIASAYMAIGDYYYRQKNYAKALKSYLNTKHFLSDKADEENKIQIETRIKELQIKLGKENYNKIITTFKYSDEI